jgi:predicted LPLAT superfamily acyltransferase
MNTALAIKEALDEKALVTLLVDRARPGNEVVLCDFLGHPAPCAWERETGGMASEAKLQEPASVNGRRGAQD